MSLHVCKKRIFGSFAVVVLEIVRPVAKNMLFENCYNQIIFQIVFRENSNASKLCLVASDQSVVSFSYINELHKKKAWSF